MRAGPTARWTPLPTSYTSHVSSSRNQPHLLDHARRPELAVRAPDGALRLPVHQVRPGARARACWRRPQRPARQPASRVAASVVPRSSPTCGAPSRLLRHAATCPTSSSTRRSSPTAASRVRCQRPPACPLTRPPASRGWTRARTAAHAAPRARTSMCSDVFCPAAAPSCLCLSRRDDPRGRAGWAEQLAGPRPARVSAQQRPAGAFCRRARAPAAPHFVPAACISYCRLPSVPSPLLTCPPCMVAAACHAVQGSVPPPPRRCLPRTTLPILFLSAAFMLSACKTSSSLYMLGCIDGQGRTHLALAGAGWTETRIQAGGTTQLVVKCCALCPGRAACPGQRRPSLRLGGVGQAARAPAACKKSAACARGSAWKHRFRRLAEARCSGPPAAAAARWAATAAGVAEQQHRARQRLQTRARTLGAASASAEARPARPQVPTSAGSRAPPTPPPAAGRRHAGKASAGACSGGGVAAATATATTERHPAPQAAHTRTPTLPPARMGARTRRCSAEAASSPQARAWAAPSLRAPSPPALSCAQAATRFHGSVRSGRACIAARRGACRVQGRGVPPATRLGWPSW